MPTVYECCVPQRDVNKTLRPVYYADTCRQAIEWLAANGGGVLRHALHNFTMTVEAKPGPASKATCP